MSTRFYYRQTDYIAQLNAMDDVLNTVIGTAQAAADAAAASYDSFDDRYLGVKATAPTVDNDGNTILQGALYWNSVDQVMYVRNGSSAWVNAVSTNASAVVFVPTGNIAATNVQAALVELDNEKALLAGSTGQAFSAAALTATGQTILGGTSGAEGLRVTTLPSAVSRVEIGGDITGSPNGGGHIYGRGSDTNVGLLLGTQGAGAIRLTTSNSNLNCVVVPAVTNAVNYLNLGAAATGIPPAVYSRGSDTNVGVSINTQGSGQISFTTSASFLPQAIVNHVANSVNYLSLFGAAAGQFVKLSANGPDANITTALSSKGTGNINLSSNDGANTSAQVAGIANSINYVYLQPSATGSSCYVGNAGTDANIPLGIYAKSADINFFTNSAVTDRQLKVANVTSAVNYVQISGAATGNNSAITAQGSDAAVNLVLSSKGTGSLIMSTGGGTQLQVNNTVNAVNFPYVAGASTGNYAVIGSTGSDTNVGLVILPKNSGSVAFNTTGGTQLFVTHTPNAVNSAVLTGSSTGSAVNIGVTGSDTNIDLKLTPKGTGSITTPSNLQVSGFIQPKSKSVDTTNSRTTFTVTTQYSYLTGTAGASYAVTLPAATAANDGLFVVIMSTATRASTTWTSTGGSVVGAPSTLTANTPVALQYHHATTSWYIST